MNLSLFVLLLLPLLLLLTVPATADSSYQCDSINTPTGNYTANSTYLSNLKSLFSALETNSTGTGFAAGIIGVVPNQVSGLILCRGDINASTCSSCLSQLYTDILATCQFYKTATMWHDMCYMQYSNQDFLSLLDNLPLDYLTTTNNVTGNQTLFFQKVTQLMSDMASLAINNSTKFFATGEVKNFSRELPSIYGLLQCTPNMAESQCQVCLSCFIGRFETMYGTLLGLKLLPLFKITSMNLATISTILGSNIYSRIEIIPDETSGTCIQTCLQNLINKLIDASEGKDGAWLVGIYCNIRYDKAPFYDGIAMVKVDGAPLSPSSKPILPSGVNDGSKKSTVAILAIAISLVVAILSLLTFFICLYKKKLARRKKLLFEIINSDQNKETMDSFLIGLSTLKAATLNFDESNKLGEGGFGAVYKGTLPNGQEVAVKRLSQSSSQGLGELRTELLLVAKLKHKNLVRVLGVCLEGPEKLLIYEFLPNRSLDTILFDKERRHELDWLKRLAIINGIARGLQYLHEDSQLKIIHRDLKASNILLDSDMNPKISDFGLARLFPVDQTVHVTRRVVGTFGYMAPEYAMHGRYSIKSDVFSFGVLLLEIITGKRSSGSFDTELSEDLLGYTWENWIAGMITDIIDPSIDWPTNEIIQYIHIGLLCVQEDLKARPRMSEIVIMLGSDTVSLQAPSKPAFYIRRGGDVSCDGSQEKLIRVSQNELTISEFEPR